MPRFRKTSPFVLTDSRLAKLATASNGNPATLDLVRSYRQTLADVNEMGEMLSMELDFFGV